MSSSESLHILLTNDDGHAAPGIQALSRVLRKTGHRVSMVAPSKEQSATSTSVTSRRNLTLEQFEENSWHLDGQPADTVLVAMRHLLESDPPDLVISGINFGPNLGNDLHISGTIGAAVIAALLGVPAIAVSAGMQFEEYNHSPLKFPSTYEVLEPAAEFTYSVVKALLDSREPEAPLLPRNLFLNINYPALPKNKIKGVLQPDISDGYIIKLVYDRCAETGLVAPRYDLGVDPTQPHKEDGDVRAHLEGYITISAIKPRWNPPASEADELRRRLDGIGTGL